MIPPNKTGVGMNKLKAMWRGGMVVVLPAMVLMTWTTWTGCAGPRVIRSDEVVSPVKAEQSFVAPMDGWFMSDALYLRYRKAVADRILELESGK